MNVETLVSRIVAIYPSATPDAMAAMKPVYHANLDHYEGEPLKAAAEEVFGAFKATRAEPFPKPIDFKTIAAGRRKLEETSGASIRRQLEDRSDRSVVNFANWHATQGLKIQSSRPDQVYRACVAMARDECGRPNWRYLSAEQIGLCERRALSQERVKRFGALPKDGGTWWAQIEGIGAEWGVRLVYEEWRSKERGPDE